MKFYGVPRGLPGLQLCWSLQPPPALLLQHRDGGKGGSRVDLPPRVVNALTFSFGVISGCPGNFPALALGQEEAN